MPVVLTPNACAALKDDYNYRICVDSPVLRVVDTWDCPDAYWKEASGPSSANFSRGSIVNLFDGADSTPVLLPADSKVYRSATGYDGGPVSAGDVIRIECMIRIPVGRGKAVDDHSNSLRTSNILVYSMELCTDESEDAELIMTTVGADAELLVNTVSDSESEDADMELIITTVSEDSSEDGGPGIKQVPKQEPKQEWQQPNLNLILDLELELELEQFKSKLELQ